MLLVQTEPFDHVHHDAGVVSGLSSAADWVDGVKQWSSENGQEADL